eukprot:GFUD01019009.1.p1 GENE.GFUD01019009.1~~GFUD01019009.1.p1  ORF type:complete len:345 (-),score=147.16 GFUD01019009.1:877-1911(-)
MAERRKSKKKLEKSGKDEEKEQMTKLQKRVVNWLKKNVPIKKTKFMHSHVVEYFSAVKALDALMNDSPWSPEKAKEGAELKFDYREQAIDYMADLLRLNMFHRAKKIPVAEKEKKKKKDDTDNEDEKEKKSKADEKQDKDKEKKRRKIRLEMHMDQVFLDSNDAYVWLYDPTPWYYYIAGAAIVLGIIAVCLFPLWPMEMRQGVYYLSVAAAGFLVFIIVLAIIKYIVFVIVFLGSAGKLKLWIFPNLTEDVGFFESFWPMYVYTYEKPKKDHDSDDEESSDEEEEEEKEDNDGAQDGDGEGSETGKDDKGDDDDEDGNGGDHSDTDNSKSSDGTKEFEIINKD